MVFLWLLLWMQVCSSIAYNRWVMLLWWSMVAVMVAIQTSVTCKLFPLFSFLLLQELLQHFISLSLFKGIENVKPLSLCKIFEWLPWSFRAKYELTLQLQFQNLTLEKLPNWIHFSLIQSNPFQFNPIHFNPNACHSIQLKSLQCCTQNQPNNRRLVATSMR